MGNSIKLPKVLLGYGLLAMSSTSEFVHAQEEQRAPEDSASISGLQEIIVMARRREERLQDVPQTIQALPGGSLEGLNLFDLSDLGKVVAGVSLQREGGVTTMRGVSFNPTAQTNASASFYINEGPVQTSTANQSMFDIEQFEVLKGPQGTLRGQSAPTGAITVRTRRPDLSDFGGMVMTTVTDSDGRTVQGALNLPVIEDVFALRVAGIVNRTDGGGVRSVSSSADPFLETKAFRISARVEPTDYLQANIMYQKLDVDSLGFGGALVGEGSPGTTHSVPGYAEPISLQPGYNGPPIRRGKQRTVREYGDRSNNEQEFASAQIDFDFSGQSLAYVGAWSTSDSSGARTFGDVGNMITGDYPGRSGDIDLTRWSHELRLSSAERLFGILDYTVGVFHLDEDIKSLSNNGVSFRPGAFGSPLGAPMPFSPNLDFSTTSFADRSVNTKEWSYFGNLTFHLTDNTELSGGIRRISAKRDALRVNSQTGGYQAQVLSEAACLTDGGTYERTYAGVCDLPIQGAITGTIPENWKKTATVYSFSLSHRFTPNFMGYVSYGTSWRPGPTQGQIINGANDPDLDALVTLADEKSKSFEVGAKTSWFDDRLALSLAYYRQEYDNFVNSNLSGVPYLADTGVGTSFVSMAVPMNSNVDVTVDGVDLEMSLALTERWRISGGASWADARYSNEMTPCWDGNFDGIPDQNPGAFNPAAFEAAGVKIAQCLTSGRASQIPKWNATLRTTYSYPITDRIDGFVRGLVTYTPENPYANPDFTASDYALIDITLGVNDETAGWELQLFAKNITNERVVTNIGASDIVQGTPGAAIFGNSGYTAISYLRPRELGLTVRYRFGSH